LVFGGEIGIRTLGTLSRTSDFELFEGKFLWVYESNFRRR